MKKIFLLCSYYLLLNTCNSFAQVQWASKLIDFSSEYKDELIRENSTRWSATQVLGYPNTMKYGQSQLAWTPAKPDNGKEFVTVGYATPQMVQQVIVGENCNAGAIAQIILYDDKGKKYEVFENNNLGAAPKFDNNILTYIKVKPTYNVVKLKLVLNTTAVGGGQEIDCIGISSTTAPYKQVINVIKYNEAVGLPENLGANVNSQLFDHLPIISPDASMLYFTRKLQDDSKAFNDDIYVSSLMPTGKFSKGENIGPPLNTSEHNFVCYVSSDNNRLYVANKYIKNTYNFAGLSLSSKQKNGDWSKPKPLDIPNLYNKNEFAHYHMSIDENVVLMAIQRDDSYGDLDLYISQKYTDGDWSEPKNLGPIINTVGAEGSVFLAADGRTIYFSSTGHPGFGNYDMYMSKRLDNTWTNWTKPLNLGENINSEEMDIYYTIPAAGDYAYFSSGKTMYGLNDLYRIKLPKEIRPEYVDIKKILSSGPVKKEIVPTAINTQVPVKQETKPTSPVVTQTPTKTVTSNQPVNTTNPQTDDLQKKLDELKKQQNNVTPTPPVAVITSPPAKPITTVVTAPQPVVNTPTDEAQKKLDELKKQQNNPVAVVAPIAKEEIKPIVDNQPKVTYKTVTATPTNFKTEDELLAEKRAAEELKKQQAVKPTVTEEDLLKKPEGLNTIKPYEAPKQEPKPLTKEQLAAQQEIKNNPKINPNNDPLNQAFKKTMPTTPPAYTNIPEQTITPPNNNYVKNEVDPNTLAKQPTVSSPNNNQTLKTIVATPTETPAPVYNQPLKTTSPQTDDLQQKLDELKKQQATNKIATASTTINSNKTYDPNANTNYYPNPTAPVPTSNAKADALQQKLDALKEQQRQVGQSNKIADNYTPKPYEAQPLKERQEDKATQDYDDYQKKLDALKAQQKAPQPIAQNTTLANTNTQPKDEYQQKLEELKKQQKAPTPKQTSSTISDIPSNTQPITQTTTIAPNPIISKYEEKLRKLKEEMAALGTPVNPVDTKLPATTSPQITQTAPAVVMYEPKKEEPRTTTVPIAEPVSDVTEVVSTPIKTNIPTENIAPVVNPMVDMVAENARLDSIKEAQKIAAQNLDKLGSSKQDLEKDITDLQDQRTKFAQEKDKLAAQNTQLSGEKEKLEAEKKKMDDLLAQMQAERDKLAAEKLKMEQDKAKLEALKKQQEKEVLKLNRSIDSLGKIQQTASNNADLQKKYDLFNVPIEVGAVAIADRIFFVADAAFLQIPSYPEMDKVVAFLKKNNKLKIEIGGHTNGLCDDAFCNKLSNDRAKACVDYLVSKGIERNRLSYKGYGKQYLIASPGSPVNQRVEIKILSVN
jgi:outer membrane protein OmpA-like peptidoglycan-associated protein